MKTRSLYRLQTKHRDLPFKYIGLTCSINMILANLYGRKISKRLFDSNFGEIVVVGKRMVLIYLNTKNSWGGLYQIFLTVVAGPTFLFSWRRGLTSAIFWMILCIMTHEMNMQIVWT